MKLISNLMKWDKDKIYITENYSRHKKLNTEINGNLSLSNQIGRSLEWVSNYDQI